jgi:hypothetical protein
MSAFSADLENKVMNHVLGGSDYSRLATVYLALFTAAPNETGGGTEVSGSGYSRLAITNNATNFPASSGGQKSNGTALTFAAASGGAWGTVTHWALMSASSGGDMLFFGALNAAKAIADTDVVSFPVSALSITLD